MQNKSPGVVTIRSQHHLFSVGKRKYVNCIWTPSNSYSCIQFHDHLQRIMRQNRIYLSLQLILGLHFHHRLFFLFFSLHSFFPPSPFSQHHLEEAQDCLKVSSRKNIWLRDSLDVFWWYRKCPCIPASLELCFRCWYNSIPKLWNDYPLTRTHKQKKEKYSSQPPPAPALL